MNGKVGNPHWKIHYDSKTLENKLNRINIWLQKIFKIIVV